MKEIKYPLPPFVYTLFCSVEFMHDIVKTIYIQECMHYYKILKMLQPVCSAFNCCTFCIQYSSTEQQTTLLR